MFRRAILVLSASALGCRATPPLAPAEVVVQPAPASASAAAPRVSVSSSVAGGPFPTGARWTPPLEDAVSLRGELTEAATLEWCSARAGCRFLTQIPPPCHVFGAEVAPSRRFLLVWYRCQQDPELDVYDVGTTQRTGHARTGGGPQLSPITSGELRWTAADNILLSWSAGSNAAEAELYDAHGKMLLAVSGDTLSVSPRVRYLATFPGFRAPRAGPLEVYDLTAGAEAPWDRAPGDIREVRALRWTSTGASVRFVQLDGHVRTTSIDLAAPP